jgi:hypothetical protein
MFMNTTTKIDPDYEAELINDAEELENDIRKGKSKGYRDARSLISALDE